MLIDTPTTHQTNKPKETEDNATELALVAPKSTKIGPNAAEVPCHPIRAAEPVLKPISGSKLKIPAKVTPNIFSMIIIKMITATNCNPILPARPKALILLEKPTAVKNTVINTSCNVVSNSKKKAPVLYPTKLKSEKNTPPITGLGIVYFVK